MNNSVLKRATICLLEQNRHERPSRDNFSLRRAAYIVGNLIFIEEHAARDWVIETQGVSPLEILTYEDAYEYALRNRLIKR